MAAVTPQADIADLVFQIAQLHFAQERELLHVRHALHYEGTDPDQEADDFERVQRFALVAGDEVGRESEEGRVRQTLHQRLDLDHERDVRDALAFPTQALVLVARKLRLKEAVPPHIDGTQAHAEADEEIDKADDEFADRLTVRQRKCGHTDQRQAQRPPDVDIGQAPCFPGRDADHQGKQQQLGKAIDPAELGQVSCEEEE